MKYKANQTLPSLILFIVLVLMGVMILGLPWPVTAQARDLSAHRPQIAIIMDDMGERWEYDRRIVALEGAVTCAFFSFGAHTTMLAQKAHAQHKEVMLHLPMQPMQPMQPTNSDERLDEEPVDVFSVNELSIDLSEDELKERVATQLSQMPHVSGVNNHQGSLLTQHPVAMQWVMEALKADPRPLFFVDSLTVSKSIAAQIAREQGVPTIQRHVFLDHDPAFEQIEAQFARLVRQAKSRGYAVAIGHPFPTTVDFLEKTLPSLSSWGVELVPVSDLIQRAQHP